MRHACRDYADEPTVHVLPFTVDIDAFYTSVFSTIATGGEDAAEDVFSGLEAVTQLNWQAGTARCLVHFADYSCHGSDYHSYPAVRPTNQHRLGTHNAADQLLRRAPSTTPTQAETSWAETQLGCCWTWCEAAGWTHGSSAT